MKFLAYLLRATHTWPPCVLVTWQGAAYQAHLAGQGGELEHMELHVKEDPKANA